jgi:hypothetical protein
MPVWGWVLIVVIAAILIVAGTIGTMLRRRSGRLRSTFGPEYDRAVEHSDSRREAESELAERERRRKELDIRPLGAEARDAYARSWQRASADFVDSPTTAVAQADALVIDVMRDRGYPMDDFEQRAADVSVDHPEVVERYREGHRISQRAARGEASTEDLRQAMQHYRELFNELLEPPADEPATRERDEMPLRSGRAD